MQRLSAATKSPSLSQCVAGVLDGVPPVMRFIRREMRGQRGVLTVPQFRALIRVNREPRATVSAVAEHLSSSLPTASRVVSALVRKGLLSRETGRVDRRQVSLSITPHGRVVLETARARTQTRLEAEMGSLSGAERETVGAAMALLKRLFGSAGAAGDGGADFAERASRKATTTAGARRAGENGAGRALRPGRPQVASMKWETKHEQPGPRKRAGDGVVSGG